jgi:hypothetical protein
MQLSRSIVAIALAGMVAAACGGGSPTQEPGAATQGPAATDGGGGGATEGPSATQSGGGGGGGAKPAGWDQYGKVSYEASAPVSLSGELGFIPAASVFGGDQGTTLSFSYEDADSVLSIVFSAGVTSVSFGSNAGTVIGTNCTTSNLSIQATSASGSFECKEVLAMMASGAQVANVTLKGTFDAHA